MAEIPRSYVELIISDFANFLRQDVFISLHAQLIQRLEILGDCSDQLAAFRSMINDMEQPFKEFKTEFKLLNYLENDVGSYIPPQQIKVGSKTVKLQTNESIVNKDIDVTIEFITMRKVLTQFFELPGIFESTLKYMQELENEKVFTSNIIQSQWWEERRKLYDKKNVLVWPAFVYNDDVGTNNPIGGHQSEGKIGIIDFVLPVLPPNLQSKVDNIFLFALYKTEDLNHVTLKDICTPVTKEMNYLADHGITVSTSLGIFTIHFITVKLLGDNLAVNMLLGFTTGFKAKMPCRFCLIHSSELSSVLRESDCILRNENNYLRDVDRLDQTKSGITGESAFCDLRTTSTLELITVDVMHDLLEGICKYDLGLVLHFLIRNKYFTLQQLNEHVRSFDYGEDEKRNKPQPIKPNHIADKYISMHASEILCLVRNIGVFIGEFVPRDNNYWKVIILLKDILDIVTSPVIHSGISDNLEVLIHEYLSLLVSLVENYLKPKHHFLLHYPSLMKDLGPLWTMNTMRCESKNREAKVIANSSYNRVNVCKSIAVKTQLRLSYRFLCREPLTTTLYENKSCKNIGLDLTSIAPFISSVPEEFAKNLRELTVIEFRYRTIAKGVVLSMPTETDPRMFIVQKLVESEKNNLGILVTEITDFIMYDNHYQAYNLLKDYDKNSLIWQLFTIKELSFCHMTRISTTTKGEKYIGKRWI